MEFRKVYPIARLCELLGNVNGGIPRKKNAKPRDSDPYDWRWFIPPFAAYEPLMELYGERSPLKDVDDEALRELYASKDDLPPLFYMVTPWPEVRARLGITE